MNTMNTLLLLRQIGGKVAYYRKMRNLTQAELAERVSVSASVISRLERGKYSMNLPLGLLLNIAAALDIHYSLLLDFKEEEEKVWWGSARFQMHREEAAPPDKAKSHKP